MKSIRELFKYRKEEGEATRKAVLLSVIALCLLVIVFSLEIYAWFSQNNMLTMDDIELATIGESDSGSAISVSVSQNNMENSVILNQVLLYPDSYAVLDISLFNNSINSIARSIVLDSIGVHYPTATAGMQFDEKYILTGCYFDNLNNPFDETLVPDKQSFFKSFIAPATNAFNYAIYVEERTGFHEGYTPQKFSSLNNASSTELQTSGLNNVIIGEALSVTGDLIAGGTSSKVDLNGRILMTAGEELDVYLVFYFDPIFYSSSVYGAQTITLKNSNPFMSQRLVAYLDCVDSIL